jgi:hypothetical protein
MKRLWKSRRIYRFQDDAPIVRVIILQAAQEQQRRTDVDVVGEEAARDARVLHARPGDRDEGSADLRLKIAVVPGVAGRHRRSRTTGRLKKEVRVAEEGKRR